MEWFNNDSKLRDWQEAANKEFRQCGSSAYEPESTCEEPDDFGQMVQAFMERQSMPHSAGQHAYIICRDAFFEGWNDCAWCE